LLGLLGLLALGFLIANLAMTGYTVWMLVHPPRRTYATALARGIPGDPGEVGPDGGGPYVFESWETELGQGRGGLKVWDVGGKDAQGPVVVFVHGWGDSRIGGLSRLPVFAGIASRVLMFDLRGHGESGGTCGLGVRDVGDLGAVVARIGGERPIVLVGWSMGAGVAIAFAASGLGVSGRVAAVIAESAYRFGSTPARNVLRMSRLPYRINLPLAFACLGVEHRLGLRGFDGPRFDRAALASRLKVPLLVIHGLDDRTSPPADGKLIAQAAPNGEFLGVADAGHHGLWTKPETGLLVGKASADFVARQVRSRMPV